MGKTLDVWLAQNGGKLAELASGSGTFSDSSLLPGSTFGGEQQLSEFRPTPAKGRAITPYNTFEPARVEAPRRRSDVRPEDVRTTDDLMAAASDEQVGGAYQMLSHQLGGDEGVNRAAQQITGRDPRGLSKAEKANLLVEFGLRLMSASGADRHGGDIGAAIGEAGTGAISSLRQRAAAEERRSAAQREEARREREERSQRELRTAQTQEINARTEKLKREAEGSGAQPPNWITYSDAESGYQYAINVNDPENRIKLGKLTEKDKEAGDRPFEFERKFDYFMKVRTDLPEDERAKEALAFSNRTEGMTRSEAYKFALEQVNDMIEQGTIYPEKDQSQRDLLDSEVGNIMENLGFGRSARRGGSADIDVTSEVPREVWEKWPEGQPQRNRSGQVLVRRGDKVYYVGEAGR